jgi:4-hydroxybenzoate polyprenyltransferase
LKQVKNYLSLIKFSHTIFAMPFALIGFFLGTKAVQPVVSVMPDWYKLIFPEGYTGVYLSTYQLIIKLLLIIACMVFARSAAMAFNRYLDSQYDAQNPRTAIREIPAGTIKSSNALWFVVICSLLFMATTIFINRICFFLSPIALFVILFYSYTKRFTALCHLVLGVGLALAPIGAYVAVTGVFNLLPILFSCTVLCWVSGFDIIYALQDEAFDKKNQLHSIPAWLGKHRALRVSQALHLLAIGCLVTAGLLYSWGIWYWIGVAVFGGLLVFQHSLVKPNDLGRVNMAFFTTNGIASVVFAAFVITDLLLR